MAEQDPTVNRASRPTYYSSGPFLNTFEMAHLALTTQSASMTIQAGSALAGPMAAMGNTAASERDARQPSAAARRWDAPG